MADEEKDYQQNYYDLLKDESYKSLLSKEVQYDNARKRALKNTNASLGAMGMQSSGYGQTANAGIEGQYLQALEGANQTFQQEQTDIGMEEAQYNEQKLANQQFQDFSSISNLMTATSNREDLDYLMNKYGLYTDGQFDYNKAVELYGDEYAKQLDYLYRLQAQGIEDNALQGQEYNYTGKGDYTYYDEQGNVHYITLKDGKVDGWNAENKTLNSAIQSGEVKNNSYIKLQSKKDNKIIYVRYYNGKLYYCTPNQYNSAKTKYSIYGYESIKKVQ